MVTGQEEGVGVVAKAIVVVIAFKLTTLARVVEWEHIAIIFALIELMQPF